MKPVEATCTCLFLPFIITDLPRSVVQYSPTIIKSCVKIEKIYMQVFW